MFLGLQMSGEIIVPEAVCQLSSDHLYVGVLSTGKNSFADGIPFEECTLQDNVISIPISCPDEGECFRVSCLI